ncbi:MAG: DUF1816 domain-containing protein [Cyanobacteria bacterium]|nr:DUF1816 domain-containing protein [Cyanobacteria bacterium CG_2015-16_32_12]NCO77743.1 DUF1816 domain-containing protein [Cyanobacteria bacterium CG_2015-22_32_23]NCQ03429.1 DUF1816 domain-containing protein [Cyanobacteria bacterium CG_2015-09_32_10]NCQ42120.1 DUF1816 domain-containing protein [Cyanobacteria bacterium CG_2015-04_32_10]NCS83579.1 DUF1816 domain-containing protein [Cyanobacteria bacterium CG_2015-02_32_10]
MKELLIRILDLFGLACWVEISTEIPRCIYYFGPFLTLKEAKSTQDGYIEDLTEEGAKNIVVTVKRCKPKELTIFDDLGELKNFSAILPSKNEIQTASF